MLDKPSIFVIPLDTQERYKPVTKCTYWPVLGSFNNWNVINLSQKSISSDSYNEIHQVVLDGISDNMASLVEPGQYGSIKLLIEQPTDFMLICSNPQENITIDG